MSKTELRIKSVGTKVTEVEYAQLEAAARAKDAVPTVNGPIQVSWKWQTSDPKGGVERQDPASFTLILHNPSGEVANIELPERDGKAPSSVTLNGQPVSGPLSVRSSGEYTIEAHY